VRVGVLGTGSVGQALGNALLRTGHEVCMGSRTADNPNAREWASDAGDGASHGTFENAAAFGEALFNCTSGNASLDVLNAAGAANLDGKVLVDVSNSLDFSGGFPPKLGVCNDDSIGEQLQRAFPRARVVKSLNTVNAAVMSDPAQLPGRHDMFVCGNDAAAKDVVRGLLTSFGWKSDDIHDLGGIEASRAVEMYLPLWLRLIGVVGNAKFNIHLVR